MVSSSFGKGINMRTVKNMSKSIPSCKHLNGSYTETYNATHQREVEDGKLEEYGYNEMGDIKRCEYTCYNCGTTFYIKHPTKKNPKWLQDIIAQLGD